MLNTEVKRKRISWNSLVADGLARCLYPTTDTGYKLYGPGRLFLPAETNYNTNPAFAGGHDVSNMADGWAGGGSGVTITYDIVDRVVDGKNVKAQKVRMVGGVGAVATPEFATVTSAVGTFAQNDPVTAACYIKVTEISGCLVGLNVIGRNAAGAYTEGAGSSSISSVMSDFVRYSCSKTLADPTVSRVNMKVVASSFGEGDVLEFELALTGVSKSSILTPYFDGTYPDCAWTGTANASTSTRTASSLTVPVSGGGVAYTYAGVMVPLFADTFSAFNASVIDPRTAGGGSLGWFRKGTSSTWYGRQSDGSNNADSSLATGTWAAGSRHVFTYRGVWGATADMMVDGAAATQANAAAVAPQTVASLLFVGAVMAHYVGPLLISPVRKSDAWTDAIQANGGAAFADPMRLFREFMEPGDMLIPLQDSSAAYVKLQGSMPGGY